MKYVDEQLKDFFEKTKLDESLNSLFEDTEKFLKEWQDQQNQQFNDFFDFFLSSRMSCWSSFFLKVLAEHYGVDPKKFDEIMLFSREEAFLEFTSIVYDYSSSNDAAFSLPDKDWFLMEPPNGFSIDEYMSELAEKFDQDFKPLVLRLSNILALIKKNLPESDEASENIAASADFVAYLNISLFCWLTSFRYLMKRYQDYPDLISKLSDYVRSKFDACTLKILVPISQ